MLAYAESFQASLARVWRPLNLGTGFTEHNQLFLFDFGHTKGSVQSLEDVASWRQSGTIQFVALLIGTTLSSFALWGAAVQVRPILCHAPGQPAVTSTVECEQIGASTFNGAAIWLADNPRALFLFLPAIAFAIFSVFIKTPRFFRFASFIHVGTSRLAKAIGATVARFSRKLFGAGGDLVGYLATLIFLGTLLAFLVKSALRLLW